jgi:outer membrane protein insertion porin family
MIFRRRLNRTCGWIWLLTLFALPWKVQAQLPQARTINKIIVTNIGPQAVSESLVRANLRVKEGDPFVPTALNDDVPNLYATGYFSDIRVADEQTPDGVNLYYFLKAKPKVTDITFAGNRKYSTRKLSKKLTSKIGEPLDERKLFLDSQEIKKMYQKSGYPQTQVR